MSKFLTLAMAFGLVVGTLLIAAAFAATPTGGAGLLITPSASVTTDPGRGTPDDPGPVPTSTPTRPAATPATPTVVPTPTPRAGTLAITPASAAVGAEVSIRGAGFSPNAPLVVIVEDSVGSARAYVQPGVDGSGNFTVRLDTRSYVSGEYAVTVASLPNIGTLARATFTLTGVPGLPNTGEGAGTGQAPWTSLALGGAALLALLVCSGFVARRRMI